ncbi:hypothetical protein Nepgr_032589 [Nepenthes gracilis]|uniref:Uncharacterized protein n=1 Tax=Nepenthes gracilis TaxID=150966 RepID=A0AAD3TKC3_NEPGR|nr:hypothetical protein Nepgr_032589 [Nepenthes gracilis]
MASSLPPHLPAVPDVSVQGDLEMVSDIPLTKAVVSAPPFVVVGDCQSVLSMPAVAPGNSNGVVDAECGAGVLPRVSDPPENMKIGLGSNLTAASLLNVSERSENSVDAESDLEVGFPRVASCPASIQLCNQQSDQPPVPSAGCNHVKTSVVSDGNTVAPFPSVREVSRVYQGGLAFCFTKGFWCGEMFCCGVGAVGKLPLLCCWLSPLTSDPCMVGGCCCSFGFLGCVALLANTNAVAFDALIRKRGYTSSLPFWAGVVWLFSDLLAGFLMVILVEASVAGGFGIWRRFMVLLWYGRAAVIGLRCPEDLWS